MSTKTESAETATTVPSICLLPLAGGAAVGLLVLGEDLIEGLGGFGGLVGFRNGIGFGGARVRHEGLQPLCMECGYQFTLGFV